MSPLFHPPPPPGGLFCQGGQFQQTWHWWMYFCSKTPWSPIISGSSQQQFPTKASRYEIMENQPYCVRNLTRCLAVSPYKRGWASQLLMRSWVSPVISFFFFPPSHFWIIQKKDG